MNSFIIDAEIVAIDAISGQLRPFQELATRARKDVRADNVSVAVCVFVFDLMYLDGEVRTSWLVIHRATRLLIRHSARLFRCFLHSRSAVGERRSGQNSRPLPIPDKALPKPQRAERLLDSITSAAPRAKTGARQ
jgi:hypothetical protein